METVPGGEVFVSKYGVNTTMFDFTEFNRSRADTGMNVSCGVCQLKLQGVSEM